MRARRLTPPRHRNRNGGFALIIALIILLAITVVGVTTIRSTLTEQRLANATLDRNIAFQAAEAALRVGETLARQHAENKKPLISGKCKIDADDTEHFISCGDTCDTTMQANCVDGVCMLHDPDCPLRSQDPNFTGWTTATELTLGSLAGQNPQYIVEFLGADFYCRPPDPTAPNDPNNYCKRYRITARSQPNAGDRATVILETLFVTE
ncbi:MAG: PilX N-terminal domain-containing pilus assembly protein [Pseudomonadota bacterium]